MFGIGQFAQIAGVSVRTLRHYDEVGLLRPAAVDPATGYRSYAAPQLQPLNRILVLKDLGFSLAEITRIVEAGVSTDELVGMLRLRQAEALRAADLEQRRLARVAARIDLLTGGSDMTDIETAIVVKALEPARVAVAREPVDGFDEEFGPVFGRLYPTLFGELARLGVPPAGFTYGLYEERADGRIDVLAGVGVSPTAEIESSVVEIVDLAAAPRAATLVHRGAMDSIRESYALLERWMDATDERPVGFSRELYLEWNESDPSESITELQFVLA